MHHGILKSFNIVVIVVTLPLPFLPFPPHQYPISPHTFLDTLHLKTSPSLYSPIHLPPSQTLSKNIGRILFASPAAFQRDGQHRYYCPFIPRVARYKTPFRSTLPFFRYTYTPPHSSPISPLLLFTFIINQ